MLEQDAILNIQKMWRKFSTVRRQDGQIARELASCIGTQINSYESLQVCSIEGSVSEPMAVGTTLLGGTLVYTLHPITLFIL